MKKLVSLALVSAMSLSLLAGCGGEKPTPSQAPAEESKAVAGEAFNMNVNIASEPESLDPAKNTASDGNVMIQHMFEGLMTWKDSGEAVEGTEMPTWPAWRTARSLAMRRPSTTTAPLPTSSTCGTISSGPTARTSPPATSSTPGSVWPTPRPLPTTAT